MKYNGQMAGQVLVSVIIPVYNVEKWLPQCLESVTNQTFADFEVLLIDDGSTDGSAELCNDWARQDDRIKVVHKKNEGPSAARNKGMECSKGEYLVFVDADDWLDRCFLEKLYDRAVSEHADMAECDVWRVNNRTGHKTLRKTSEAMGKIYSLEEQMEYGYTAIWKCMFHRRLFTENHLLFPDCHSEARAVYPLLLCLSKKRIYVQEPLYYYRLFREGSLSAVPRKNQGDSAEGIAAYEILIKSFRERGLYEKYKKILKKLIIIKLADLLAAFLTQRQPDSFLVLTEKYRQFLRENFQDYQDKVYLTVGGYNLNKILSNMNILHDPSGRFGFSSLISIMNPIKTDIVVSHKNKYRSFMLEREIRHQFWSVMEEKKPEFIVLDFIEERFDLVVCCDGYLTKSDAFDGCETKTEAERVIVRDSEECTRLWQDSARSFIQRMETDYPDTKIILVANYLSEMVGDIHSRRYFEDLEEIRKINRILKQYYLFFKQNCNKAKVVEASECENYYTDRLYEYGAVPSHLNELVNREIAEKIEGCIG